LPQEIGFARLGTGSATRTYTYAFQWFTDFFTDEADFENLSLSCRC